MALSFAKFRFIDLHNNARASNLTIRVHKQVKSDCLAQAVGPIRNSLRGHSERSPDRLRLAAEQPMAHEVDKLCLGKPTSLKNRTSQNAAGVPFTTSLATTEDKARFGLDGARRRNEFGAAVGAILGRLENLLLLKEQESLVLVNKNAENLAPAGDTHALCLPVGRDERGGGNRRVAIVRLEDRFRFLCSKSRAQTLSDGLGDDFEVVTAFFVDGSLWRQGLGETHDVGAAELWFGTKHDGCWWKNRFSRDKQCDQK